MKTLKVSKYAAAIVAVVTGVAANAATLTLPTLTIGPTALDFVSSGNVAKFNSAGTLTKVTVSFTSTLSGTLGAENVDANNTSLNARIGADVTNTITFPSGNTFKQGVSIPFSNPVNLSTYDNNTDGAGTSGFLNNIGTPSSTQSIDYTDAATLAAFTGAGNVTFNVSTLTLFNTSFQGGQLLPLSQGLLEKKDIVVTYTYTPPTVPEGEFPLAVAAVVGALGFWQYRRRIAKA